MDRQESKKFKQDEHLDTAQSSNSSDSGLKENKTKKSDENVSNIL